MLILDSDDIVSGVGSSTYQCSINASASAHIQVSQQSISLLARSIPQEAESLLIEKEARENLPRNTEQAPQIVEESVHSDKNFLQQAEEIQAEPAVAIDINSESAPEENSSSQDIANDKECGYRDYKIDH